MFLDKNAPIASAWNTWSDRPGEFTFLPLGVRLAPVLYSGKAERATTIRAPDEIRFGHHGLAGERVDFETRFAETRLAFTYEKPDPFTLRGEWAVREAGEWGLRHWVTLCLSAENGSPVQYDARTGIAVVEVDFRFVALAASDLPVLGTGHESVAALVEDFDRNGYFDKSSRADKAPLMALRFNLEMTPRLRFAVAVADSRDLAIAHAQAALAQEIGQAPALHTGRHAGALDAVRDVIGWNTVYDPLNRRPVTAASRIWGLGDAVWFNDQCFAGLMAGLIDPALGRHNFEVAMTSATPQGNIACLVNPKDAWVDRTQAPHGAFMAWMMYQRSGDRAFLADVFEPLVRNQLWWRNHRDPDGRGLVSCGTSDWGDGMYRGTAFGARNETGMDNSPTHDEARYDPETRTLSLLDVGLNSALALDAEMLARIAAELGQAKEATSFAVLAETTRALIRTELWDETRGLFANRQRDGGFVRSVSPTSFFPLLCGAADGSQVERLLAHLADPDMFGGPLPLPNVSRDDPAYPEQIYWRGRIWPNVNYLVWQALRRSQCHAQASELAERSYALFEQSWTERRWCGENYGAETGEIDDMPGNDPFYTWGAMLPLMAVGEIMDVNPWDGWELVNDGQPVHLGPLASPAGPVSVEVAEGRLALRASGGALLFATDYPGRLAHVAVEDTVISVTFAQGSTTPVTFRLGREASARLVLARLGDQEIEAWLEDGCAVAEFASVEAGARLDWHLTPASYSWPRPGPAEPARAPAPEAVRVRSWRPPTR
ncbi:MGH1-like glycoside hydrolase domain-containing protein [Aureimonas sp. D3]|uniref:MGH1-like glycoside hydrolase domain-containing protein n=1 Tax=Aureimonas sp. D3 TaxID=1638164 RepID=UPI0009E8C929|nr:trehalase family glycosidase [Aureimonas sp. D3]